MKIDFGSPKSKKKKTQKVITKIIKITLEETEPIKTEHTKKEELRKSIAKFLKERINSRPFIEKLRVAIKKRNQIVLKEIKNVKDN